MMNAKRECAHVCVCSTDIRALQTFTMSWCKKKLKEEGNQAQRLVMTSNNMRAKTRLAESTAPQTRRIDTRTHTHSKPQTTCAIALQRELMQKSKEAIEVKGGGLVEEKIEWGERGSTRRTIQLPEIGIQGRGDEKDKMGNAQIKPNTPPKTPPQRKRMTKDRSETRGGEKRSRVGRRGGRMELEGVVKDL